MDCFWTTIDAFNLAEEFQVPVDRPARHAVGGAHREHPTPGPFQSPDRQPTHLRLSRRRRRQGHGYDAASGPETYLRYQITADGVSPMAIPGTRGGAYVATGLEHTQAANTSSDARNHTAMTDKRFRSSSGTRHKAPPAHEYGDPTAEIGFLTWGSTFGVVCRGHRSARGTGYHGPRPGARAWSGRCRRIRSTRSSEQARGDRA